MARHTSATADPLFSDPEGLVILGGLGDDTYVRSGLIADPILLVDPAGNDVYRNSAGGACPVSPNVVGDWLACNGLVVSVVADLGGLDGAPSNDQYLYDEPTRGSTRRRRPRWHRRTLLDVWGDDLYSATNGSAARSTTSA